MPTDVEPIKIIVPEHEVTPLPEPVPIIYLNVQDKEVEAIAVAQNQKGFVQIQTGDLISRKRITHWGEDVPDIISQIEQLNSELTETEDTFLKAGKAALSLYKALGDKLTIARQDPQIGGYGKWAPWLKSHGVDYERAKRAIRISTEWEKLEAIAASENRSGVTDFTLTEALNALKRLPEGEEAPTFESVVELFKPWGSFERNPTGSKFKYILSGCKGHDRYFRGLNEATKWHSEHCNDENRLDTPDRRQPSENPISGAAPFAPDFQGLGVRGQGLGVRGQGLGEDEPLNVAALKIGDRIHYENAPCVVTEVLETGEVGLTTLDGTADHLYVNPDGSPTNAIEIVRREEEQVSDRVTHSRQVMTSSKTDEHYTPSHVLECVYHCFAQLGGVGLDPCSNAIGDDANVIAENYYTIADDGLIQSWEAKTVYINPPYSDVAAWVEKAVKSYDAGSAQEILMLVKADPSTQWFQKLWANSTAVCFVDHRLRFINESNDGGAATFASAIAYFGSEIDRFYHSFESLGVVVQVVNPEMFGS